MGFYRKRPVVVEAFQMTKDRRMDNSEWPEWLNRAWNGTFNVEGTLQRSFSTDHMPEPLDIITLEGRQRVGWDDFIIQGVHGELYPCKPDIFVKTYEEVA